MIGWVRRSAGHRLGDQLAALKAAGVEQVYGANKGETVISALKHAQGRGSCLLVVTTLARLGTSKQEISDVVDDAHDRDIAVLELSTGRRTDSASPVAVQMAMDAAEELANDHRAFTPSEAVAAAEKRWVGRRKPRTSRKRALVIWRDKENYKTVRKALEHPEMAGWSLSDCYRRKGGLGPRYHQTEGRGGRPRNTEQ